MKEIIKNYFSSEETGEKLDSIGYSVSDAALHTRGASKRGSEHSLNGIYAYDQ